MKLADLVSGPATAIPAIPAIPEGGSGRTVARIAKIAVATAGTDYTQEDLAEFDRLIAQWHELTGAPSTAIFEIRRRLAPVNVRAELDAFRAEVQRLEGAAP